MFEASSKITKHKIKIFTPLSWLIDIIYVAIRAKYYTAYELHTTLHIFQANAF